MVSFESFFSQQDQEQELKETEEYQAAAALLEEHAALADQWCVHMYQFVRVCVCVGVSVSVSFASRACNQQYSTP